MFKKKNINPDFDVLILGTSLSGLAAALQLSKKNYKVAIVSLRSAIGKDADTGEPVLSRYLGSYLKRMGLDAPPLLTSALDYSVSSGQRFKVHAINETHSNLNSLQLATTQLLDFMFQHRHHIPSERRWERSELRQYVKNLNLSWLLKKSKSRDDALSDVLEENLCRLTEKCGPFLKEQLSIQSRSLRGYPELGTLKRYLLAQLKDRNVKLISCEKIEGIDFLSGSLIHLTLFNQRNEKSALIGRTLIMAGNANLAGRLFRKNRWKKLWNKSFYPTKIEAYKCIQRFHIDQDTLPQSFGLRGLFYLDSSDILRNRRKRKRVFRYTVTPLGEARCELTLSTFINALHVDQLRLKDDFKRVFESLVPFASFQCTPIDAVPFVPFQENQMGDIRDPFLYRNTGKQFENLFSYQSPDSYFENIYLCSREVLPSMATDGEILVGMQVGKDLNRYLEKNSA